MIGYCSPHTLPSKSASLCMLARAVSSWLSSTEGRLGTQPHGDSLQPEDTVSREGAGSGSRVLCASNGRVLERDTVSRPATVRLVI